MAELGAIAALGSLALGAMSYSDAKSAASEMRRNQELAKIAEEEYLTGKLEADVSNYEQTMNLIDKYVEYWAGLEADPRAHPQFEAFKASVYDEADRRRSESEDALRRRGITGGRQEELFRDVEFDVQNAINETLLGIQSQAKQKQFELESMRPGQPYKGMPGFQGVLNVGQAYAQYPQLPNIDLSGLGEALAYFEKSLEGKGTRSSTSDLGSTGLSPNLNLEMPDFSMELLDIDPMNPSPLTEPYYFENPLPY